jgi:benzodiazapine receptor
MSPASLLALVAFLGACTFAASMGAIFRPGEWYEALAKPSWRPPNWLFAPVWACLYISIAVSGWLVWRVSAPGSTVALAVFALQLALNAAWTPIFFGLHRPDLAFYEIVFLWLSIVATIALFYTVQERAALLLMPYLAWVTFAAALNFSIWQLNGSRPA